jgi:hypothetical protein
MPKSNTADTVNKKVDQMAHMLTTRHCSSLKAFLYLIVRELDKGVILFRELGVQDMVILFSNLTLTFFQHALTNQTNLRSKHYY